MDIASMYESINMIQDKEYPYYKLTNGDLISKERVDMARELLARLDNGYTLVNLSEEELFSKGDKVEAIRRFKEKHDCSLMEAKTAIEYLRGN